MVRKLTENEIKGIQNWLRSKYEQNFGQWQEDNK
jgi:hypothetical protein